MKSIIATLALLGSIASTTQASSWAKFESKWMENNFMRWHYSFGGDALFSWGQVFLEAIRKEEAHQAVGVGFGGNGQPSGEIGRHTRLTVCGISILAKRPTITTPTNISPSWSKECTMLRVRTAASRESLTTNIVTEQVFSIVIEWLGWKGGCTEVSKRRIHKVTSEWADLMMGSGQFEMEFT
jgi:hypothetical protein